MTAAPPVFKVVDAAYESNREGPRLAAFESILTSMSVGKAFDIPTRKNAKGKVTPTTGINIKAVNLLHAPAVFRKKRVRNDAGEDVLRVFRIK